MATKWGIISAGKISHDFVSSLRSLPENEHKVVAVGARKLEDAKKFAEVHHIPKATSYDGVAKDPEIEVVYVGAINTQHFPLCERLLEAGKHLLVEKPLTLNLKQTTRLLELAKSKGLFLMEALWSRFLPAYQRMMEEIHKGTIGEVCYAEASFGFPMENVDRVMRKKLGGSSLLDIGIYTLNLICMAFGGEEPTKIAALGHLNEEGVDESIVVSLKYGSRKLGSMTTSTYCKLPNEAVVVGTRGQIKLPFPFWCPTEVILPNGDKADFPLPPTAAPCNYINSAGLRYEAMEVRRCLQQGLTESPTMSHKDSLLLARLMDEIRKQVGVQYPEDAKPF